VKVKTIRTLRNSLKTLDFIKDSQNKLIFSPSVGAKGMCQIWIPETRDRVNWFIVGDFSEFAIDSNYWVILINNTLNTIPNPILSCLAENLN